MPVGNPVVLYLLATFSFPLVMGTKVIRDLLAQDLQKKRQKKELHSVEGTKRVLKALQAHIIRVGRKGEATYARCMFR